MLLKSLQLTVKSIRGITRVINPETYSNVHVRNYARFAVRNPVAIENEDELFDIDVGNTTPQQPKLKRSRSAKSKSKETPGKDLQMSDEPIFADKHKVFKKVKENEKLFS